MRRLSLIALAAGTLLLLIFAGTAFAQTAPPPGTPPPTSMPVPLCPPDLQKNCEWFLQAARAYGPWFIVLVIIGLGGLWLFQRFGKVADTIIEEALENTWQKAGTADALDDATTRYLKAAIEDYRFVKFRGRGARERGIEPPELDHVYVSLTMQPEAVEGEPGQPGARGAQRPQKEAGGRLVEARLIAPVSLAEALALSPKLALVGVAGSGKSTLLQWAGLAAARSRLGQQPLTADQQVFISALGPAQAPLPVLLPLRDYNRYCRVKQLDRSAHSLLAFIPDYIASEHPALNLPADFFSRQLGERGGGCLLMFDGVDEVATADRQFVREAIEGLLADVCAANPRNRYLVTSRTYAYFGPAEVSGFRECRVQNLDPTERDLLIHKWYAGVEPPDRAEQRARDLCASITGSDARVRDLAVTPLMVTIFALVHYDDGTLPRQRAALYESAVSILLTETAFKQGEAVKDLAEWGGLNPGVRRNRLARIAFAMHDQPNQRGDEMAEDDLLELIWPGFGAEKTEAREQAREFIQLASDRGGLLEFQNGRYGFFTHRTFREFLAGRYLAEELSFEWARELTARFRNDQWREPILLAAGYLAIGGGEGRANAFVRQVAHLGLTDADRALALTLAGLAFADLPAGAETPLYAETRSELVPQLTGMLTANPPRVLPAQRRAIGLALAALGDPRFTGPFPQLITIPAGEFLMGTSDDEVKRLKEQFEIEAWSDEQPQHLVFVSEFQIGRYPVTNAEYRAFVDAQGYVPDQPWWQGDGRAWRRGELKPDLTIYSGETRKNYEEWLERRPAAKRHQPFFWDDPQWNADNLPVVGLSWYEADAYCRWLSAGGGPAFRLPTEAEWERAARGPGGGLWPWGHDWDPGRCNSSESELNATTPVGMYPHGAAVWPAGAVEDLVGNVWEWCGDWFDDKLYSQRDQTGLVVRDPPGSGQGQARVVRGGSYFDDSWYCRAASRNRPVPASFLPVGLRVARSP